jgi:hypothetical protein
MRLLLALLLCLTCHAQVAEVIHNAGPRLINIVVVGDGYTTNQFDRFRSDATNTFKALREAFSTDDQPKIGGWWVYRPSKESGCDDPSKGIVRDTAYNSGHDASINRLLGPDYYGTLLALGDSAHLGLSNIVTAVIINTTAYGGAGGMVLSASSMPPRRRSYGMNWVTPSLDWPTNTARPIRDGSSARPRTAAAIDWLLRGLPSPPTGSPAVNTTARHGEGPFRNAG